MMKFGLLDTEIENIHKIFSQNQEIEKVIIFGSRAKGNYRNNSDIDLVIFGNINLRILNQINIELDNLLLPYTFDLLIYKNIENEEVKEHINELLYKLFFERIVKNSGFYKKNKLLKSIYKYFKKIIIKDFSKAIDTH